MLKKLLSTIGMVLLITQFAFAQTGALSGQVTDAETGETVPGANILITELDRGAVSDVEGNYSIANIPAGTYTLRVTFVGYQTFTQSVQIVAGQEATVNAELEVGAIGLDELVVAGYAMTPKRELTGSIASVRAREFQDVPLQNTESILQGRAAGVQVTSVSGNPGSGFRVNIRGNGSINAATEPLYIIDGVQISQSQLSTEVSTSPLNSLNPSDIESIEVLKDAASAAIYGSQAAAGVVLITTKRGASGDTQITARAETGIRDAANRVNYIGTDAYLDYMTEAVLLNNGLPVDSELFGDVRGDLTNAFLDFFGSPDWDSQQTADFLAGAPRPEGGLADTDWQRFIYDTGVSQRYNVSATGGDDRTRFFISGGFEDTDGTLMDMKFERLNLRTNFDHQMTDRVNASVNLNVARSFQFGMCEDGNFINCGPSQAMFEAPMSFPFSADGEFNPLTGFGLSNNPAVVWNEVTRDVNVVSITGNTNLNYRVNDWLNISGLAGLDYRDTEDEQHRTAIAAPGQGGWTQISERRVTNFNTNLVANARYTFNGVHNVTGLLGTEYRRDFSKRTTVRGDGFPGPFFRVLNAAADPVTASGITSEFRIGSYFGNLQYNYDERYFINLVGRYDGHSRFGADTRWGFFPSISGAWRISEEDFFDVEIFDELKLRAGFGTTGNANIGNFAARGLFSAIGSYQGQTALQPTQLENANLSWEEAREINIGLDFSILAGRISGEFDVYRKDNRSLLFERPLPNDSGFTDINENIGSVRNEGVEFAFNSVNVSTRDFVWSTRFNIGLLRNEVLELPDGEPINLNDDFEMIEEGRPIGQIFVPRWAGVNPADGRPMWFDGDGNLTYTPVQANDAVRFKDGVANVVGGFGNTVSFRGLQLDAFFEYSFGRWGFGATDYWFTRTPDFLMNLHEMVENRWRQPGDITYFPRAVENGTDFPETANFRTQLGTHSIHNASYIRLKNITLSYNLPTAWTERVNLRGLRVFATGINLVTWTEWPFFDPEIAFDTTDIFGNFTQASIPTERQANIGIEIQF